MDLIDVPSTTGEEQAVAEMLYARFTGMGLRARLQEVEPGESNVIGRLPGGGGGLTLLFLGHLDTTWSGREEAIRELGPAYQPVARRDGDWIYGMGAYNMKSGLACAIEAVQALVDADIPLRGDVVLAGVVAESPKAEVGRFRGAGFRGAGKGARHLVINGLVADYAVLPEPTNGQVSISSGGYLFFELVTRSHPGATYVRPGAVGAQPAAPDAIGSMMHVLDGLRTWGAAYEERSLREGGPPLHYRLISVEGGLPYRPSKAPAICRAMVEVGTRPGQHLAAVAEEVREAVREASAGQVGPVEVEIVQSVPGASVDADESIVKALVAAHTREHGAPPMLAADGWLADTTHLTRYGIPAVCYGPAGRVRSGGSGFYATDGEQCYLPDLVRGARVLADLAADVGSRSRDGSPPPTARPNHTIVV